jgi:hypothetical protein
LLAFLMLPTSGVAGLAVARAGTILAVSDFAASLRFYRDQLGLAEVALYDDPPSRR